MVVCKAAEADVELHSLLSLHSSKNSIFYC